MGVADWAGLSELDMCTNAAMPIGMGQLAVGRIDTEVSSKQRNICSPTSGLNCGYVSPGIWLG